MLFSKAILTGKNEIVFGNILIQLVKNNVFKNFRNNWPQRYGPIIVQDMELCWSPFLKSGTTFAILRRSGKIPVQRDWLMICVRVNVTVFSVRFRKRAEIPSWPELFFVARFLTIFSTSVVLIHSKSKEDITLCFKKEEIVLVPLYSMLFESFAQTLTKNC